MKRILSLIAALALGAGACQKQQTETERHAKIERQLQQRMAAERQADERKKIVERQSKLEHQINALADKQRRAAATPLNTVPSSDTTLSDPNSDTDSYSTFYRKLEPYGDWMETGDYGYVFQPRQAAQSRDWRPYANGHWIYTDAGWTWISDEKFGWATYHYGRWTRLRSVGWVWVPGEEWAPAWVSWRKGGDYVGWAPLPPEAQFDRQTGIHNWADNYYDIGPEQYAFVPASEFGRKLTPREIVPSERNVTIINQTTNVTNIVYNNSLIVDRGPSYEDLRSRSRQPIERYRLERNKEVNNEIPVFRGEVVTLPTTDFRPAERAARPNRIVRTIPQPVVERGWMGIQDAPAAEKARNKMKAEAIPPPNLPPKRFVRPEPRSVAAPRPPAGKVVVPTVPSAKMEPVGTPAPEPSNPAPAPPEKRKQRQEERAQREAERQQEMAKRHDQKPGRAEVPPAASPEESGATAAPSAPEAAATSPVASTPSAEKTNAAEQRRGKRAEKRAERRQAQPNESPQPSAHQP